MKANESASQHFLEHEILALERHLLQGLNARACTAAQRFLYTLDVLLARFPGATDKQLYPFVSEADHVELVADLARRARVVVEDVNEAELSLIVDIVATRGCRLTVHRPTGYFRLSTPKGFVVLTLPKRQTA